MHSTLSPDGARKVGEKFPSKSGKLQKYLAAVCYEKGDSHTRMNRDADKAFLFQTGHFEPTRSMGSCSLRAAS